MKKQFAFLTILMMAASLTACAAKTPADQSAPIPAETAAVTAAADHSEPEAGSDHGDWLSKACGTWIIDMDGDQCELRIESSDEAYLRLTIDATHDFYFDADESCMTKTPGIFVAGDCRRKNIRQVTTAASDGATAALAACRYLNGL